MSVRACDVLAALDALVPLRLAEPWDNVGLLLGDQATEVKGVLLTIDLTPEVVREALRVGANLVIAYHPPMFRPQKAIVATDLAYLALHHHLVVLTPHTALDAARGGTCDVMAERLELLGVDPLVEKEPGLGAGRVGQLDTPVSAADFVAAVKRAFGVDHVLVCGHVAAVRHVAVCAGAGGGLLDVVVAGLPRPSGRLVIDAYVTGELSHHEALRVVRAGKLAVLLRHSVSERPALESLCSAMAASIGVPVTVSLEDHDPMRFA